MKKVLRFVQNKAKVLGLAGAAVIGGLTVGAAFAAIPDGGGVIHACYRNTGNALNPKGSVRVINTDASEVCTAQETALNWSQTGPQGPPGTPGTPGAGKTLKVIIEGEEFGPVVDRQALSNNYSVTFFYEPIQRLVSLEVPDANNENKVIVGIGINVLYLSNDCTGTPYTFIGTPGFPTKNVYYNSVLSTGYDKQFAVNYNEPSVTINPASTLVFDASTDVVSCNSYSEGLTPVVPLVPVTVPIDQPIQDTVQFVYN